MIDEKVFLRTLDEVIDKDDEIIVLYSGLWTFIGNINFKIKNKINIPNKILDLIEYKIGKKRTLILKTQKDTIIQNWNGLTNHGTVE